MTVDEFKDMIDRRFVVECSSVSERNQTLELLLALGYVVNEPSMKYLEPGNQDFNYPHPVREHGGNRICCTMYVDDQEKSIQFAWIASLIEYLDSNLDERNSEEFSEAFAALMG